MENRKGTALHITIRPVQILAIFYFLFPILLLSSGCGAPGEPVPPTPLVPAAIKDLAAHQAGDAAELSFPLPANSISGAKLAAPPAVETLPPPLHPHPPAHTTSSHALHTI